MQVLDECVALCVHYCEATQNSWLKLNENHGMILDHSGEQHVLCSKHL